MSEILKVLNKKNIELKSEVVELNLVSDAIKLATEYYSTTDNIDSRLKDLYTKANFIISAVEYLEKSNSKRDSAIKDIEKMAKELGIGVENIPELKDLKASVKDFSQYKKLKSTLKNL